MSEISVLSCWYHWILLYVIQACALIEKEIFTKPGYIPVKTEEKVWFLARSARH
jgi:hypothetical protein